ncbi:PIR Superfamily Protein [Plasmodium ovale wallikeri]|uniref:PIR Superfamily Protein n=1 Tax=Plasmodium ovale wallikeri TaxID=864142 RepID=A0A1A9ANB3_PLAOA|nr:PIR Superfamily Protein [Plasmodium ovale wallikeri]
MGVKVAFSEQLQGKTCMDEYNDISSDDDKKIEDVNKTDEEDPTFTQKCNILRQYLNEYSAKYSRCFTGEYSGYFLYTISSINEALTKCTNYERRLELESDRKKLINVESKLGEKDSHVDHSEKGKVSPGEEDEATSECKEETCKTKHLENQEQSESEGMLDGEPDSRSEQITSGSSQELGTPTDTLSTGHEVLGTISHVSSADPEDKDSPSRAHASDTLTIQPETGTSTCYTGILHTDVPGDASLNNFITPVAEVSSVSIILNLEKNYIVNKSSTCSQQEPPAELISTSAEDATLATEPSSGERSSHQEMAPHQKLMSEGGKQPAPELPQESFSQPASAQGHLARAPITLTQEEESGKNTIKIKKKKKKRQRIQDELDRIMYSPSIFDEQNMYLPYTHLENTYYVNEYDY